MGETRIRRYQDRDADVTARIFFDAVHVGLAAHYDAAQRRAWVPRVPETTAWRQRLGPQVTFVAERDGRVVGFMTMTEEGYLDLAYVAPDVVGQGVAKALYDVLLAEASRNGIARLYAEASHMGRRFFERQGWSVVKAQTVHRAGVAIPNFVMEKVLA